MTGEEFISKAFARDPADRAALDAVSLKLVRFDPDLNRLGNFSVRIRVGLGRRDSEPVP